MDHLARTLAGGDGNDLENFRKRLDEWMVVDAFEHQEANWAVGGGDEQDGINPGRMIWREQRSAARRDVFLALQVQAVERVRSDPRQQPQNIGERTQGECGNPKENAGRAEPQVVLQEIESAGCAENADERIEVRGRQDTAAVLLFRTMLNQSADGN